MAGVAPIAIGLFVACFFGHVLCCLGNDVVDALLLLIEAIILFFDCFDNQRPGLTDAAQGGADRERVWH